MELITSVDNLRVALDSSRAKGLRVGFVPTMGALHKGHLSLIGHSATACDVTVCSVFVNPTQFNDPSDFERYPRDLQRDVALLETTGCAICFAPDVSQVYPTPDAVQYELGAVAMHLEGAFRPGHFNGVASVVHRLFNLVQPDKAFFGLKDYQQYLVVKQLAKQFHPGIEVVGCEIVRDPDGLAMSSRNQLLNEEQRKSALYINKALKAMKQAYGIVPHNKLAEVGINVLNKADGLRTEYLVVADPEQLTEITDPGYSGKLIGLVAVYAGNVRLIDNMAIN